MNSKRDNKQIRLVFPTAELKTDDMLVSKGISSNPIEKFSASIDEIQDWFKQYDIDSIELSISGTLETGGILNLIVNAKGEGGIKVTLKPKEKK